MQRSLCQLSTAILLAACLLLQSVQCQPVVDQSGLSPSSALENYLTLRALLLPQHRLPEYLHDDMFNDMERSRRSGPAVDAFEPLGIDVLRRLLKSRHAERQASRLQNIIDSNKELMRQSGRR